VSLDGDEAEQRNLVEGRKRQTKTNCRNEHEHDHDHQQQQRHDEAERGRGQEEAARPTRDQHIYGRPSAARRKPNEATAT
jgi:hypothetical protein